MIKNSRVVAMNSNTIVVNSKLVVNKNKAMVNGIVIEIEQNDVAAKENGT